MSGRLRLAIELARDVARGDFRRIMGPELARLADRGGAILKAFASKPPRPAARKKAIYIGAPACFALEMACQQVNAAFGGHGCFVVGSALERPNWRDVDVRMILTDDEFARLFPDAGRYWEHNPRWLLMTTAISAWLSKATGLPIDFQFQPQTHANERHSGPRHAYGTSIRVNRE